MFKKKTYLIISDLDGTLLTNRHGISPDIETRLNNLIHNEDILFTYATGRDYIDSQKAIGNIRVNAPVILCNGSIISDYDTGRVIMGYYLEKHVVFDIVNRLVAQGLEAKLVCVENDMIKRYTLTGANKEIIPEKTVSIAVVHKKPLITRLCAYINEAVGEKTVVNLYSNPYHSEEAILDITPKNVNKGEAVKTLKNLLDKKLYTICFGNDSNDQTLLEQADYGIAVGDCPRELIKISSRHIEFSQGLSVMGAIEDILKMEV